MSDWRSCEDRTFVDKPIVFISYSHIDEIWKDLLLPQLKTLQQLDRIVVWNDRKIDAGDKWYPEIKEAMEKARIAICLISANYLASDFCLKEEVPFLLQRCEKEGLILIPILIKPARGSFSSGSARLRCCRAMAKPFRLISKTRRMSFSPKSREQSSGN
jgi:TIR domain